MNVAGRKLRDEDEAVACLEAADISGLGDAAWARRHGIDGRSLHAWRLNLERREGTGSSGRSPVRVVELVPGLAPREEGQGLRVRCGAFVVEVEPNFDAGVLTRVLEVLASC